MKTKDDIELITVGQLVEDLAEFEEEYSDWDVVCWTPDGEPCYPTSVDLDEEGDLRLSLNEDDGDNYDVESLLEELGDYDDDVRVYVAARGLYLSFEANGEIFEEDCDEDSDIDVVACHGTVIGEYEYDIDDDDLPF